MRLNYDKCQEVGGRLILEGAELYTRSCYEPLDEEGSDGALLLVS